MWWVRPAANSTLSSNFQMMRISLRPQIVSIRQIRKLQLVVTSPSFRRSALSLHTSLPRITNFPRTREDDRSPLVRQSNPDVLVSLLFPDRLRISQQKVDIPARGKGWLLTVGETVGLAVAEMVDLFPNKRHYFWNIITYKGGPSISKRRTYNNIFLDFPVTQSPFVIRILTNDPFREE